MRSLLIRDVMLDGRRTSIYCEDGAITAIGSDLSSAEGTDVLDGRGCVALAPLINSHTHAAMTLFRGNGDDLPLMEWLQNRVWPYEQKITEEEIYAGTRLAIVEMVRNGTIFFNDMYWNFHGVARAVEELGVRACVGQVLIDHGDAAAGRAQRSAYEDILDAGRQYSSRVSVAVAPHSVYTVSEESLRWAAELAAAHDCIFHTHVSETESEVTDCLAAHGCTPVEYLDRLGALGERTVAAHTVWLSDHDIELLGQRGVVCVHNPVSNMKLAVGGVFPYSRLSAAGAVCAIATDGAGSNNSLDLFQDLKFAALIQKFHDHDTTALSAPQALAMAIADPAPVFGLAGPTLEVGRAADLILVDTMRPEMQPQHSLASNLVYSATGNVVDSTVCDGRVIMRHREIRGEAEIISAATEAAERLFERVDGHRA
jgi:5-methylthioadenosine/S-adenosylhomocysteine deaminase